MLSVTTASGPLRHASLSPLISILIGGIQKSAPRTLIRQLPTVRSHPLSVAHSHLHPESEQRSAWPAVRQEATANDGSCLPKYRLEPLDEFLPSSRDDIATTPSLPILHESSQAQTWGDVASTGPLNSRRPIPESEAIAVVRDEVAAEDSNEIAHSFADSKHHTIPKGTDVDEIETEAAVPPRIYKDRASRQTHAARLEKFKARQRAEAERNAKATTERPDKSQSGTRQPKPPAVTPVAAQEREKWQIDKAALHEKMGGEAWNPKKKLSPDALEGIRTLHAQHPEEFTTPVLAQHFKISPEAVRRILKSKWRPTSDEEEARRERWDRRGEKIWTALVDQGVHAPKKWREMGIGSGPRRASQARQSPSSPGRESGAKEQAKVSGTTRPSSAWVRSLARRLA